MDSEIHQLKKEGASFTIDLSKGGKLHQLTLSKDGNPENIIKVISTENAKKDEFLGSGSYLMFPWVNRLSKNDFTFDNRAFTVEPLFKDPNGFTLHGLVASTPRKVIESGENFIKFQPVFQDPRFPQITETLSLISNTQFQVTVDVVNTSEEKQIFGLGYHPYFSLNDKLIDDLVLHTNMDRFIQIDQNLLPIGDELKFYDHEILHKKQIGNTQLDNGLSASQTHEQYWTILFDPQDNYGVKLFSDSKISQIPMKFWQFYTAPDRKTIAIEPLTCGVDVYNIKGSEPNILLPGESKQVSFIIESITELKQC